jgi:Sulfatase-modifying factor enzyme 1
LWGSGPGDTIPVMKHAEGMSVGGVQQMVGNVWEWTSTSFGAWEPAAVRLETDIPLKSLRGGAFDTYFEAQAQCQFQSGDSPLARKHNIGFRCAIGFHEIAERREEVPPVAVDDVIREPGFAVGTENDVVSEKVLS